MYDYDVDKIENAMRDYEPDEGDWPTGEMVDVIIKAYAAQVTVRTLTISHKHGEDTSVHLTEETAKDALHAYVQQWWSERAGMLSAPDVPEDVPEDRDEAISLYFTEHPNEYYSLSEPVPVNS